MTKKESFEKELKKLYRLMEEKKDEQDYSPCDVCRYSQEWFCQKRTHAGLYHSFENGCLYFKKK